MADTFSLPDPYIRQPSTPEVPQKKPLVPQKSHADDTASYLGKEKLAGSDPTIPSGASSSAPLHATRKPTEPGALSEKIARQAQQAHLGALRGEPLTETSHTPKVKSVRETQIAVKEIFQNTFISQMDRLLEDVTKEKNEIKSKYTSLSTGDAPKPLTQKAIEQAELESLMGLVTTPAGEFTSDMERELEMADARMAMQKKDLVGKFYELAKPVHDSSLSSSSQVIEKAKAGLQEALKGNRNNPEALSYLQPLLDGVKQLGK